MLDGQGIFPACKAKKRRQYFVYCKIFQHSRTGKGLLRQEQTIVNMGSYTINPKYSPVAAAPASRSTPTIKSNFRAM